MATAEKPAKQAAPARKAPAAKAAPAKSVPTKAAPTKTAPVKAVKDPVAKAETAAKAAPAKATAAPAMPEKVSVKELAALVHAKLPMVALGTTARVVEEAFIAVAEAFSAGAVVSIKDFGKLAISDRPARTGRNPQTGAPVAIAAKRVPKFTFAKALKDRV